jgi:hypothetical protein
MPVRPEAERQDDASRFSALAQAAPTAPAGRARQTRDSGAVRDARTSTRSAVRGVLAGRDLWGLRYVPVAAGFPAGRPGWLRARGTR